MQETAETVPKFRESTIKTCRIFPTSHSSNREVLINLPKTLIKFFKKRYNLDLVFVNVFHDKTKIIFGSRF